MTKITINIDTEGDEPKVTTTTENANADIPKAESPKEDTDKEELKNKTPSENESTKDESPKNDDSKKMDMTEEEHAKMSADFKRRFYVTLVITIPVMLL